MVPATEIQRRLSCLQQELQAKEIDGALIVEKIDYYYFTGTMQSSFLFVPATGRACLFVVRDYQRARSESPLQDIAPCSSPKELPQLIREYHGQLPATLGMEFDVLPVKDYFRYQSMFPRSELVDISPQIRKVRSSKSAWEIAQMEKAAQIGAEVYATIPKYLRPGVTEIELAGLLEAEAKKRGHEGLLRMRSLNYETYTWHIVSGANGGVISFIDGAVCGQGLSPAFPVGASLKPIAPGEPVLVDFGAVTNGYQVDETRMYCIGPIPDKFRRAYRASLEIEQAVLAAARPGVSCDYLYRLSVETAEKLGFGSSYLGPEGQKVRFVGHGVGLEINELPFLAQNHNYPLEEGMTFAIEPKLVFPGEGAVGIEDTVLVETAGCRRLTTMTDDIIEV